MKGIVSQNVRMDFMNNTTLAAIGEALIDFIPDKSGCAFYEVTGFAPKVGGAPANVCGAYAKLGGSAKLITQLGDDPFGEKIRHTLAGHGIDTSCIRVTDKANTALAFVSLAADGNRTFSFYRKPSADMLLDASQIRKEWFDEIGILHFCSVSLGDFPMKDAHKAAITYAREKNALISFDPNLRFPLWDDRSALRDTVWGFIPLADILKVSDEELEFLTGTKDIRKALPQLMRGNVKLVLYTCGADGAYAFTKQAQAFAPSIRVKAVDTTGAGDGFIGSFLWQLTQHGISTANLENISKALLTDCLTFSSAFCAASVMKQGAIDSYPTLTELTAAKN